jgi:hypothetical protein
MAIKICRVTGTTHIFLLLCVMPKYLKLRVRSTTGWGEKVGFYYENHETKQV